MLFIHMVCTPGVCVSSWFFVSFLVFVHRDFVFRRGSLCPFLFLYTGILCFVVVLCVLSCFALILPRKLALFNYMFACVCGGGGSGGALGSSMWLECINGPLY